MNIGVFGGTFDPPHNGHISLAKSIIDNTDIDKILFVLSAAPPHKPGKPISSFKDRMNMLEIAIKNYTCFTTSDIEYKRLPKLSYMYDTLLELEKINSGDNLILIIGEDSLDQLHSWYRGKDIAGKWDILTYPRPGERVTVKSLSENWTREMSKKLVSTIQIMPVFPVSATNIRERIINKENIKDLVNSEVLDYITVNNLYIE